MPPLTGNYYDRLKMAESGGRNIPQQVNSTGSAFGPYQFIRSTWDNLVQKHPELGLTPADRTNPAAQEVAIRAFTEDNAALLRKQGIDPTPGRLVEAHRFGADGAIRLANAAPDAPFASVLPAAAAANPQWRNKTVAEVQAESARVGGGSAPMPTRTSPQPAQSSTPSTRNAPATPSTPPARGNIQMASTTPGSNDPGRQLFELLGQLGNPTVETPGLARMLAGTDLEEGLADETDPTRAGGVQAMAPGDPRMPQVGFPAGRGAYVTSQVFQNLDPNFREIIGLMLSSPTLHRQGLQLIEGIAATGVPAGPNQTRTITRGDQTVTQEYQNGQWVDIASGDRWEPKAPAAPKERRLEKGDTAYGADGSEIPTYYYADDPNTLYVRASDGSLVKFTGGGPATSGGGTTSTTPAPAGGRSGGGGGTTPAPAPSSTTPGAAPATTSGTPATGGTTPSNTTASAPGGVSFSKPPSTKPLTESEAKNTGFYGRMQLGESQITTFFDKNPKYLDSWNAAKDKWAEDMANNAKVVGGAVGAALGGIGGGFLGAAGGPAAVLTVPGGVATGATTGGGVGTAIGAAVGPAFSRWVTSDTGRQYQAAAAPFVTAALRKDSGAAITAEEWQLAYREWIPVPGDSPEVIATKANNRQAALEGARVGSGAGASQISPPPVPSVAKPQTPSTAIESGRRRGATSSW